MRRITSRLTKPLAVLATAALVGMGGGVAYADDTPTPPTSSTASNTPEPSTESTADSTAQQPVEKDKAEKPAADSKATSDATADKHVAVARSAAKTVAQNKTVTPYPTEVPVPTQAQTDPCNPEGVTFNASWNSLLPDDTGQIDWSESLDGKVRTATLKSTPEAPLVWNDGSVDPQVFTLTDSGEACTVTITKVPMPAAPESYDPCNPAGVTSNIAWVDELPVDTDQINWTENAAGTVRTAALKDTAITTWEDGSVAPLVFELPADSGEACEGPGATEVPVPTQAQTDPCNPEGVTFNASWNSLLPDDTGQIDWSESLDGKVRTATLKSTTEAPLKWSDGSTEPKVFTLAESGKACEVEPVVVTPVAPKVTPLCDTTDLVELADQPVGVVLVDAGQWVKQSDGTYKRVVKYAAAKGYTLPEGNDGMFTLTDNGEACEVPVVIAPKGSLTLTCDGGSAVLDNSASNAEVGYEIVVVFTDGNVWYFPMVLVGGETATIDLPALPAGTKVFLNAADTDLASVTAPSNCTKPEKPNKPTQPNKPEKPSKPVFNTGIDTPAAVAAVPTYGSPFNLTAAGIAFAAVLFLAWVIQVLRTRRIAPMFFRR